MYSRHNYLFKVRDAVAKRDYYRNELIPAHRRLQLIKVLYLGFSTFHQFLAEGIRRRLEAPRSLQPIYYELLGGSTYGAFLEPQIVIRLFKTLVARLGLGPVILALHFCRSGRLDFHLLHPNRHPRGRKGRRRRAQGLRQFRHHLRQLVCALNEERLRLAQPTIGNFTRNWRLFFAEPKLTPAPTKVPSAPTAPPPTTPLTLARQGLVHALQQRAVLLGEPMPSPGPDPIQAAPVITPVSTAQPPAEETKAATPPTQVRSEETPPSQVLSTQLTKVMAQQPATASSGPLHAKSDHLAPQTATVMADATGPVAIKALPTPPPAGVSVPSTQPPAQMEAPKRISPVGTSLEKTYLVCGAPPKKATEEAKPSVTTQPQQNIPPPPDEEEEDDKDKKRQAGESASGDRTKPDPSQVEKGKLPPPSTPHPKTTSPNWERLTARLFSAQIELDDTADSHLREATKSQLEPDVTVREILRDLHTGKLQPAGDATSERTDFFDALIAFCDTHLPAGYEPSGERSYHPDR